MDSTSNRTKIVAPRLLPRRRARVYFFPWVQFLCALLLGIIAFYIGIPGTGIVFWLIFLFFFCFVFDLTYPHSRIRAVRCLLPQLFRKRTSVKPFLANRDVVYSLCPKSKLFAYRYHLQWSLSLMILIAYWAFGAYQANVNLPERMQAQGMLTVFIFLSTIIPFAGIISYPMSNFSNRVRHIIWYSIGASGFVLGFSTLINVTDDRLTAFISTGTIFVVFTAVYVSQRLWAGERVLNEVIRKISLDFLDWKKTSENLPKIPDLIGSKLQHDRVFILLPTEDGDSLEVIGEYGDYGPVMGQKIPIDQSLTGRAYQKKVSVAWNNIEDCPYYFNMNPDIKTCAEIAVPILHQGEVYGILDVQSRRRNVYGPGDTQTLETIARILGAALAVDHRDRFYREAVDLWRRVALAEGSIFETEKNVFNLFAEFAQEILGADQVIYFPLSLAGCPNRSPYKHGNFNNPERLKPPINDWDSSLIELILNWEPYFEEQVTEESLVARSASMESPGFVEREGISSTCFVPVGTRQERLGGLFLNFRTGKVFDAMFEFVVLSLAQSLAKTTAQIRYRNIIFTGFGRPELGIHNIVNRYGLKGGVVKEAQTIQSEKGEKGFEGNGYQTFKPLFQKTDDFIKELLLAESSIPPDFWQLSLSDQIDKYSSMRPKRRNGRRPDFQLVIFSEIERENPWVKLALYRVITEATNNAIVHGNAHKIEVSLQREKYAIDVRIENDGKTIPDNAAEDRSSIGIFALLEEFEAQFRAVTAIGPKPEGVGAIVSISIPVLPIEKESESS